MKFRSERRGRLDFEAINRAGLANLPALLRRWFWGISGHLGVHEQSVCE